MKIGLCMSVIGGGGGNDIVFNSLYNYLIQEHEVTVFSNANTKSKPVIPKFGLFRQLQTINHASMHKQDLLIFLTGIPPVTKIPVIYYHQQLLPMPSGNHNNIPPKYKKGLWNIYYKLFSLAVNSKKHRFQNDVRHFCISKYLQNQLHESGINADVIYPEIDKIPPNKIKPNDIITVCRISPEKNLVDNVKALSGLRYIICGNTNRFTEYYLRELKRNMTHNQIIAYNISRESIMLNLANSKVYFSSSKETLGLAVLESINAGCIPIVVNNTANIETIPFPELRFKEGDYYKARELIQDAIKGNYNYLMPKLKEHVKQFTSDNYQQLLESGIICKK